MRVAIAANALPTDAFFVAGADVWVTDGPNDRGQLAVRGLARDDSTIQVRRSPADLDKLRVVQTTEAPDYAMTWWPREAMPSWVEALSWAATS